ncbi:ribonuclease HI [Nitrosomonas sp.]|uniref:ribonuclease HI n=1 Tax=Nitrosomonas sp. TaxID=42353 RepID=UPI00374CC451
MLYSHIFIDGSVNNQLKIGYGAYLVVSELGTGIELLKDTVRVKRFEQTNSTRLELQTLLWALEEINALANDHELILTVYTDSQNIISLPGRRARLEESNYFSSKNKQLNNYELYQEFYRLNSNLTCEFVKVIGHQPSSRKSEIDKLFGLVDQASRRSLRRDFQRME